MTFESFSGILVFVVLLAFVLWWFPTRASRGMKNATRHSNDRFSESMHLITVDSRNDVDADAPRSGGLTAEASAVDSAATPDRADVLKTQAHQSPSQTQPQVQARDAKELTAATRDEKSQVLHKAADAAQVKTAQGKAEQSKAAHGTSAQSTSAQGASAQGASAADQVTSRNDAHRFSAETVSAVRLARRQGIKHRRVLVACLLALIALTAALAFPLHYSLMFALIPVVVLAIVLAFGARAGAQSRAWEKELAQYYAAQHHADMQHHTDTRHRADAPQRDGAPASLTASQAAGGRAATQAADAAASDDALTVKLSERQIAQAVRGGARETQVLRTPVSFSLGGPGAVSDSASDSVASHVVATDAATDTAVVRSAEIKSYRQVAQAVPRRGMTEQIRRAARQEAAEGAAHSEAAESDLESSLSH
ncbi:MAG: hypothetical protein PUF51_04990, partial [Bifidobacteriaceae bacterium]|nr:hypothetical protein [Bifidobacteriaceae bacterium]